MKMAKFRSNLYIPPVFVPDAGGIICWCEVKEVFMFSLWVWIVFPVSFSFIMLICTCDFSDNSAFLA